jgi:uncharacterized oligopeptide transporter (OPT) family protein
MTSRASRLDHAAGSGLSIRTLAIGSVLGAVLAAAGLYTASKTTGADQGSIPAALVGFALLSALARGGLRPSAHEGNIIQTIASTAAMTAITGGVSGPITALVLAGPAPSLVAIAAWCAAIGAAGCLLAIPLRAAFIVNGALPFPSAVATAEVIAAVYSGARSAAGQLRTLATAALVAGALTGVRDVAGWIPGMIALPSPSAIPADAIGLGIDASPLLLGTGFLLGARNAITMLAGAAVAWLVIAPQLVARGIITSPEYPLLVTWLLWPGVGLMVGGMLAGLVSGWRMLGTGLRDLRDLGDLGSRGNLGDLDASSRSGTSRTTWIAITCVCVAVVLAGRFMFGIHPALAVLALVLSAPLCAAAARTTGETDNTPAGALGGLGQVAIGALTARGIASPLAGGAIVNGTAMQSSVLLGNWKTGAILGTAPRPQLLASFVGVGVGAIATTFAFELIRRTYGFGNEAMPVPIARSWRATAEVLQHGLGALPAHAAVAAGIAIALGLALGIAGRSPRLASLPSPFALGMPFIIPPDISITIAIGALALALVERRWRAFCTDHATTLASGAIAGEAIAGLVIAGLRIAGVLAFM